MSPGTAREETKWAWDIHKFLLIRKQSENFGFYIRGGKEFGFGIYVSGLDKGGYAEKQVSIDLIFKYFIIFIDRAQLLCLNAS